MKEVVEKIAKDLDGKVSEKKGIISVEATIAERKAFLSRKKLTYSFKVKIDDKKKEVKFSEMLKEAGSGFSSGGGFDSEMSTGFGFKKESYNTMSGAREGTIEESSKLFGKDFEYKFDYAKVRKEIEAAAKDKGYKFDYQVLPLR
jgi:hypothetical protein